MELLQMLRRRKQTRGVEGLREKLDNPAAYRDGMILLTPDELRALAELNRNPVGPPSPLLVWLQGHGLYPAVRYIGSH